MTLLDQATGLPVKSVGIFDEEIVYPSFLNPGATVLKQFRIQDFDATFYALAFPVPNSVDLNIYTSDGFQADPPKRHEAYQCPNMEVAEATYMDNMVIPFVTKLVGIGPDRFHAWLEACRAMNRLKERS